MGGWGPAVTPCLPPAGAGAAAAGDPSTTAPPPPCTHTFRHATHVMAGRTQRAGPRDAQRSALGALSILFHPRCALHLRDLDRDRELLGGVLHDRRVPCRVAVARTPARLGGGAGAANPPEESRAAARLGWGVAAHHRADRTQPADHRPGDHPPRTPSSVSSRRLRGGRAGTRAGASSRRAGARAGASSSSRRAGSERVSE